MAEDTEPSIGTPPDINGIKLPPEKRAQIEALGDQLKAARERLEFFEGKGVNMKPLREALERVEGMREGVLKFF